MEDEEEQDDIDEQQDSIRRMPHTSRDADTKKPKPVDNSRARRGRGDGAAEENAHKQLDAQCEELQRKLQRAAYAESVRRNLGEDAVQQRRNIVREVELQQQQWLRSSRRSKSASPERESSGTAAAAASSPSLSQQQQQLSALGGPSVTSGEMRQLVHPDQMLEAMRQQQQHQQQQRRDADESDAPTQGDVDEL